MKLIPPSILLFILPFHAHSAIVASYDFDDRFTLNQSLNTDGWSSSGSNWVAGTYLGSLYSRNTTSNDVRITRTNDASFSYTIPLGTTRLQFDITARSGNNFWEAGIATSSGNLLGIGSDFEFDNRVYILDKGTRRAEFLGNETAFDDLIETFRIDYNIVEGTADLIRITGGANQILRDDVAISVTASELASANTLFIRANTEFGGVNNFTINAIPEVSTTLLGCVGSLFLFRRRNVR